MGKVEFPEELRAYFREAAERRQRSDRPCTICGALMRGVLATRRYCSEACHSKAYRQRQRAQQAGG